MIPDIKELNFPSYATLSHAEVRLADMGEKTITTQVKIDGGITPDFTRDWEVEFKGEKYIMPLRKPQGAKENTSLDATIDLTFQHWAVYQLKRWPFVTMAPTDSGTAIADKYVASVQLSLRNFINLFAQVLEHYYGNAIKIRLYSGWQGTEDAVPVTIDHSYIWDVLLKLYELFAVRWEIVADGDADHYIIKVGYPTRSVDHIFSYGFDGGLMKVERQVQSEEIRNLIEGRGGEKNLPKYYYKAVPETEKGLYHEDPDWIEELANIYFDRLRSGVFRSYIQGWKAAHISKYPGYTAVGESKAAAPWAYHKGLTDAKFDPIEYVADEIVATAAAGDRQVTVSPAYRPFVKKGSSIDLYGPLWGGLADNDDIYPTIQGTGMDIAVAVEQISSNAQCTMHDAQSSGNAQSSDEGEVSTLPSSGIRVNGVGIGASAYRKVTLPRMNFAVPEGKTANLYVTAAILEVRINGMPITTAVNAELTAEGTTTLVYEAESGKKVSGSGLPAGTYYFETTVEIHNLNADRTIYADVGLTEVKLTKYALSDDKPENTFDIWVKDIWSSSREGDETDAQYAERVWKPVLGDREGNKAAVVFTTGALAASEDYEFKIVATPAYDTSKSWTDPSGVTHTSLWRITLEKSDADMESLGVYVPNAERNGKAGDRFVFIGSEMTHDYTLWAEGNLDGWLTDNLDKVKDIRPTWVVTTDRVKLNSKEIYDPERLAYILLEDGGMMLSESDMNISIEGTGYSSLLDRLSVGCEIRLADKRFITTTDEEGNVVAGAPETLYLQSLTYSYREPTSDDAALNPDVEIVLSNEYAATGNPLEEIQGEISAIQRQLGSVSNIEQVVYAVANRLFLRKDRNDVAAGVIEFLRGLVADEIARLRGGAEFGDFEPGMATGRGGAIDDAGNGELESLRVRSYLEVLELIINRLQAIEGDTVLTESDQITEVTDLGGGNYKLKLKEKWDGYFTAMTVDTVLRGIYNTMSRGGGDYYTSWMLVTSVDTAANELTVMLYEDDEVPGEKNFAPIAMMNVARWGHRTDERRQRCLYLSSTEGRIVNLVGVRQPLITAANYGSTFGRVPEFISKAFNFAEGQEGVYTKYLFAENIFHVDHLGVPLPTIRDRGLWTAGGDYYDGSTLREATGDYEISDVWHEGRRWRCCKLATTAEPSEKTTDWAYIEGLTLVSTKTEYALSISGTVTPPESAWSETQPEPVALMWLWTRTTLTFSDGSTSVSYTKSYIAKDGASYSENLLRGSAKGWDNTDYPTARLDFGDDRPAAGEKFTATLWGAQLGDGKTHFALYNSGGWVSPGNFTDMGDGRYMLQGVWKDDDGNGHTATTEFVNIYAMPSSVTGVTSSIMKVKLERGWNDTPVWTPNAADTEAVAVTLSNDSHVFEGDTEKAVAATTSIGVTAYKGERQIETTVGTITGLPTGMTALVKLDGTMQTSVTVSVTTALTQRQGVLTIPVTADGKTYIKQFSWSLSLKGDKGDKGDDGAKGDRGAALRGPQRWADLADGFGFESGGDGETFLDVVMTESLKPGSPTEKQVNYFVCIKSHAKSASAHPEAVGSQYWKPMSTIEFVATKILLAQYALVKNLGVESLEMKDADGNIIAWIRDGNVLFNKGTFSNVKVVAGGTNDQRIELDPESKSIRIYDAQGNESVVIDGTRQQREDIEGYELELTAPGATLTPWTLPIAKTTAPAGVTQSPTLLTYTPSEDSYITVNVPKLTLAVKRETPSSPTEITGDTEVRVTLQVAQGAEVQNAEIGSYLLENGSAVTGTQTTESDDCRVSFKVNAGEEVTLKLFVEAHFASGSVKLTNPTATYVFDRYQSKIFANGMTLMRTNRDYLTIYADKNGRIYLDRGSTVGSCHRFNGVTQPATLYAARVWADIETTKPTVYAGKATVRKGTTAGQWKLTMPVGSLVHTGNTLAWPVSNKAGWTVAEVSRTMVDNALEFTFVTADPSGTAAWGAAWTVEVKLY